MQISKKYLQTGRGGTRTGQEARRGAAKISGNEVALRGGVGFLNQASQAKTDLPRLPRSARREKTGNEDLSDKAVTELEAAKAAAGEKDANLNLIWARLGDAYDADGRAEDAANAYKQAIELKSTAAYYNNLGGIYGRAARFLSYGCLQKERGIGSHKCGAGLSQRRHHPLQRGKNEGSRRAVKESNRTGSQERASLVSCSVPR